jgi:excisionase family DNA binding protein
MVACWGVFYNTNDPQNSKNQAIGPSLYWRKNGSAIWDSWRSNPDRVAVLDSKGLLGVISELACDVPKRPIGRVIAPVLDRRGYGSMILEPFVDASKAAEYLSLNRRRILDLARSGKLPAHPIGDGARRIWRFRLSELAAAVLAPGKSGLASRERASMVRGQVHPRVIGTEG